MAMPDREKVIKGLPCLTGVPIYCETCPYSDENGFGWGNRKCAKECASDALALLKEQEAEHRRLLSWLGKFCRHIDNGDAWLTDEENIAFFKEKMKQQFGWDTD